MVTIDTLIGVPGSYFREYSGIDSIVCKVVLNNKLYFLFLVYNVSLQDTTQQNWRPRPSAHGEWVASLSSLKFIFSFGQSRKPAGRQPELTPATINSPSHSYLIMTKHCNSLPDNSTAARCTNASRHWPSHRGTQLCHNHTHSYSPGSTHRTLTGYTI